MKFFFFSDKLACHFSFLSNGQNGGWKEKFKITNFIYPPTDGIKLIINTLFSNPEIYINILQTNTCMGTVRPVKKKKLNLRSDLF